MTTEYTKPLPRPANEELSKPFWEAAKGHQVALQRCTACSHRFFYPREACQRAKRELEPKEISWPGTDTAAGQLTPLAAHPMYESRRIPLKQLVQRLGLTEYDGPAPFVELGRDPTSVRLPLAQHVGAPAVPVVQVGDRVRPGDLVAEIPEGALGARLHASIAGLVRSVDPEIVIDAG